MAGDLRTTLDDLLLQIRERLDAGEFDVDDEPWFTLDELVNEVSVVYEFVGTDDQRVVDGLNDEVDAVAALPDLAAEIAKPVPDFLVLNDLRKRTFERFRKHLS